MHAIEIALAPIIGQLGVAALYRRSLHLCEEQYPWMVDDSEGEQGAMDFDALKATLAQRSSSDAAAAGRALQQHFRDSLTRLVGMSLTERLLRPTVVSGMNGVSAPDRDHD